MKRKSVKNFKQLSKVLEMVKEDYTLIFSTFTVKNCKGENLKENLDLMFKGWNNLMKDKSIRGWGKFTKNGEKRKYKGIIKGFYRALEITYNKKDDTYHPHFHCILVVRKGYFTGKEYLKQSEWVSLWERACNLDYEPIVDVRRFKKGEDGTFNKSVNEVAKYTTKDSDYLDDRNSQELNKKVLFNLDQALFRRRLIAYGGILRDIHKQLNLDNVERS
jgi:plasmid rolling circle replication initiator protein Rep